MSCTALPGWFCPPLNNLYNHPTICPEDWYCPGGLSAARRCTDNRWSAVGSIYPEDCLEHINVGLAVVFVLFFLALIVGVCIWFASWDWSERDRHTYMCGPQLYGKTTRHGHTYDTYSVTNVL
jgi:hypothetical protein